MYVCPLVFEPILRPKVWGGRRLAQIFGKPLPPDEPIGESWECSDLPSGQSIVARGPQKGRTLHELLKLWGSALTGRARLVDGRFPLLIKFLDAVENLSIQVHPDRVAMNSLGLSHGLKDEAWHILDAAPGAVIFRGLQEGVSSADFSAALAASPRESVGLLKRTPVKPGDSFYIPGGTVHALGAGVVAAEIQTPSDVTFRLYDWDRSRTSGDAGLHVQQGLACLGRAPDPARFERRSHVTSIFTTVTRLVDCRGFRLERVRFLGEIEQPIPYAELVVWIVLEGCGEIRYGAGGVETFQRGEVVVLPAALVEPRLRTQSDCVWLEVTIPVESDLADYDRPSAAALQAPEGTAASPISLRISARPKPEP